MAFNPWRHLTRWPHFRKAQRHKVINSNWEGIFVVHTNPLQNLPVWIEILISQHLGAKNVCSKCHSNPTNSWGPNPEKNDYVWVRPAFVLRSDALLGTAAISPEPCRSNYLSIVIKTSGSLLVPIVSESGAHGHPLCRSWEKTLWTVKLFHKCSLA